MLVIAAAGCDIIMPHHRPADMPPIKLVAVLPIDRAEPAAQPQAVRAEVDSPRLALHAEQVVTAQIYGVMMQSPAWHFVPDLTVDQALRSQPADGTAEARAIRLGTAVQADGVVYGSVSRFVEREGSELGARNPASVSLELKFLIVATGQVAWHGRFDQTQEPLTSNLLNWWQFWHAGPHWFSGAELARLGVEQLLDQLHRQIE